MVVGPVSRWKYGRKVVTGLYAIVSWLYCLQLWQYMFNVHQVSCNFHRVRELAFVGGACATGTYRCWGERAAECGKPQFA